MKKESPFIVNNKFLGTLTSKSVAVVMDNSADRNRPGKVIITSYITENVELLAGNNTAAVFNLIPKAAESLNSTSLFTNYLDKRNAAR